MSFSSQSQKNPKTQTNVVELTNCIKNNDRKSKKQKAICDIGTTGKFTLGCPTTLFIIHGFILTDGEKYEDIEFQIRSAKSNFLFFTIPMSFLLDSNEKIMRRDNEYFVNYPQKLNLIGCRVDRHIIYNFCLTRNCKCKMVYTTGYYDDDTYRGYFPNSIKKIKSNITINMVLGINSIFAKNTNNNVEKIVIEYQDFHDKKTYKSTYDSQYFMYCGTPKIYLNIPIINNKLLKLGFHEDNDTDLEIECRSLKIVLLDKDCKIINDDVYISNPMSFSFCDGNEQYCIPVRNPADHGYSNQEPFFTLPCSI